VKNRKGTERNARSTVGSEVDAGAVAWVGTVAGGSISPFATAREADASAADRVRVTGG